MRKKYCLYVQSNVEECLYFEGRWGTIETMLKTAHIIGGDLKRENRKPQNYTWQIVDEADNARKGEISVMSGTYNYKGDMITKSMYIK